MAWHPIRTTFGTASEWLRREVMTMTFEISDLMLLDLEDFDQEALLEQGCPSPCTLLTDDCFNNSWVQPGPAGI